MGSILRRWYIFSLYLVPPYLTSVFWRMFLATAIIFLSTLIAPLVPHPLITFLDCSTYQRI